MSTLPGPSTSSAEFLDSPQSTSTPKKPDRRINEKQRSQSATTEDSHKYTTLKSAKKAAAKDAAKKQTEQPEARDSSPEDDEGYEIVDEGDEDACEQPEAQVVVSDTDSREDLAIPMVNEEPGPFWHVTVPPGKRHLIQVLVGTPRASLSWKFSTEKKVHRSIKIATL